MASTLTSRPSGAPYNGLIRNVERMLSATGTHTLIGEEIFLAMLSQERKRSERSAKQFVLLLLDGAQAFAAGAGEEITQQAVASLSTCIRETDIVGWYEEGSVIGVIFTEMGTANEGAIKIILNRVTSALRNNLSVRDINAISISCHLYPEQSEKHRPQKVRLFYHDEHVGAGSRTGAQVMKRALDIVGSATAILMLSPVFLVIAALIKLTSKGPVLFRQNRVGQYGAPFTFLKFRSMYLNSDSKIHQEYVTSFISGKGKRHASKDGGIYKITNDPRVTPLGRFIRRTSLDELPQFFNVLRGDMSLVGPRPPVPYEFEAYDVWHRKRVFEVKPGITGLWQIKGRSRTNFDDMVRLDLQYARNWSIWMDIKILLQTPGAVFSGDGAC
ncbi:MAG TPA: sugar transferase [Terriglobales bacterium]|nr:sugar transferase [Terriglobales bacterium]